MPLLKEITVNSSTRIAVWKIEEPLYYFQSRLQLTSVDHAAIEKLKQTQRQLEWFASRYLLRHLIQPAEPIWVESDENGKQVLKNYDYNISLSHTNHLVCAIVSSANEVGIDIETIEPRIEKIAPKFMSEQEINSFIHDDIKRALYIYWSAKEAIYKLYSKRKLDFRRDMLIQPFTLSDNGKLKGELRLNGMVTDYPLDYVCWDEYVMVWGENHRISNKGIRIIE